MEGNITVTKLLNRVYQARSDGRYPQRIQGSLRVRLISPEAHGKLVSLMDKLDYIKSIEESGRSSFARGQ